MGRAAAPRGAAPGRQGEVDPHRRAGGVPAGPRARSAPGRLGRGAAGHRASAARVRRGHALRRRGRGHRSLGPGVRRDRRLPRHLGVRGALTGRLGHPARQGGARRPGKRAARGGTGAGVRAGVGAGTGGRDRPGARRGAGAARRDLARLLLPARPEGHPGGPGPAGGRPGAGRRADRAAGRRLGGGPARGGAPGHLAPALPAGAARLRRVPAQGRRALRGGPPRTGQTSRSTTTGAWSEAPLPLRSSRST